MSIKKWLLSLFILAFSLLALNTLFLYTIDTYSIVNTKPDKYYSMPNQKYAIVEYILNNPNKYDTYIFGSSRVGAINPLNIKNKNTYNMTYGEGIPHEHLLIIKLFIKQNIKIKNLLVGLDEFSYQVPFARHQNQFIPRSHYLAREENLLDSYKFYFFRNIKKHDIEHFKNKYLKNKIFEYNSMVYDAIFNQRKVFSVSDKKDYTTDAHINNPIFTLPKLYSGDEMKDTLKDIKEIVALCQKNNIEVTFFINPIYKVTYENTNQKQIKEFRIKLSYITDYYDFSFPNIINNNNSNWLEASHYLNATGDKILDRIYENNNSIKDFGIYIEKK